MSDLYRNYSALRLWERDKKWALIDTGALRSNYRRLCSLLSDGVRMAAVVKADAYGHGAPACVEALLREGCDFFAVSCLSEGIAVREVCTALHKRADILILSPTFPSDVPYLLAHDLIGMLTSLEQAERLSECSQDSSVLRLHIAADTGMHRVGFPTFSQSEMRKSVSDIVAASSLPHLRAEGIFSHFARADETGEAARAQTELQSQRFSEFCDALRKEGGNLPFCHVCNTAAISLRKDLQLDGVRAGIGLYGYGVQAETLSLAPVMKLQTVVVHLHTAEAGEMVGYGGLFAPDSSRLIATLPIGYADGFLRAYSGGSVTVHTSKGDFCAPVVGAVCMDQCMLDVTGLPVRVGDTVTLFGNDRASLETLSRLAETIPYESLCLITSRVPRKYI